MRFCWLVAVIAFLAFPAFAKQAPATPDPLPGGALFSVQDPIRGGNALDVIAPGDIPPTLESLAQDILKPIKRKKKNSKAGMTAIRKEALQEAAWSFGARAGLARRTFDMMADLEQRTKQLDKVYDFRRLLIATPNGLMIEPPVISEAQQSLLIAEKGQAAAVADRLLTIGDPARIVAAPRSWRHYLIRDWGEVTPPPDILRPETPLEAESFGNWLAQGWDEGVKQADEVFEADLAALTRDFTGMVRYRTLLAQGMVSAPFALAEERGITGGGTEMRIGDRGLRITGPAQLQPRGELWTPNDR